MALRRKLTALVSSLILVLLLVVPAVPAQADPLSTGDSPVSLWQDFVDWLNGWWIGDPGDAPDPGDFPPPHAANQSDDGDGDGDGTGALDPIG